MTTTMTTLDDADISLDQSARIAHRVAFGAYRLSHDNQPIGDEVWGIFSLLNGGYRIMTDIDLEWPVPNQQRARMDLDGRWRIERLWVQVDAEGIRRVATYTPIGDVVEIQIAESRLRNDEDVTRIARSDGRSSAKPHNDHRIRLLRPKPEPSRITWQQQLPFTPVTHLDFGSTLFNFVALKRNTLSLNMPVTFDAIVITLPSLAPLCVEQVYTYERDEPVRHDPLRPLSRRHQILEKGIQEMSPSSVTTFWADDRGITLAQELDLNGVPHGCDIAQHNWVS